MTTVDSTTGEAASTVVPPAAASAVVSPAAALTGPVHLLGIGGAGMSGIARILLGRGVAVSGTDRAESPTVAALRQLGATVYLGHDATNLDPAVATVVVSTAIRDSNPELVEARRRELPVVHRAVALAALMTGRRGVAVAGTAGKTSTTAMLVGALRAAGADPSFAVGGDLTGTGVNGFDGGGPDFVVEADESDGSFLRFSPYAAVLTNVEADHLDQHGTPEAVVRIFEEFTDRVDRDGFLVACADDPGARGVAAHAGTAGLRVRTYGEAADADLRLVDITVTPTSTRWTAVLDGAPLAAVQIPVAGRHMALNSAAVLLAALELGYPAEPLLAGLGAYGGVRRRFELKGTADGVRVYDDYAHPPTKVAAQLRAARTVAGQGRVVVGFQPHLFSRTAAFAPGFGAALGLADEVVVLDVFAAREDPMPGVSGALIAAAIPLPAERVRFEPDMAAVPAELARRARPGDLVITMGAGDVTRLGQQVLDILAARATEAP